MKLITFLFLMLVTVLTGPLRLVGQETYASDGMFQDSFGESVGLSGSTAIVGRHYFAGGTPPNAGSAYLFRDLNSATGVFEESAKLLASDSSNLSFFGETASLSGNLGIVGASRRTSSVGSVDGAAYLFRGLDTVTGTVTETATLLASDGFDSDANFGYSVSASGNSALIGAYRHDAISGAAYLFHDLDTATGTVNESAKLLLLDGADGDGLGYACSLSGDIGLVSAIGSQSAYVFRDLDTATGVVNESVKLEASDGEADDFFGDVVSLSGSIGLIGARSDDDNGNQSGAAYIFRDLDSATGTINEAAKLISSDGEAGQRFGNSVSLSGTVGLVGAFLDSELGSTDGAAYLFPDLDSATGTVTESIKLFSSEPQSGDRFGTAVALDGDRFSITATFGDGVGPDTGSAFTGTISAITTMDSGNAANVVDAISFDSRTDWIIGQTTSGNENWLLLGNFAKILDIDTAVYIGATAGSNNNRLRVSGDLSAIEVIVGAHDNSGNELVIDSSSTNEIDQITLFTENALLLEGELPTFAQLESVLGDTGLYVDSELVTAENFESILSTNFDSVTGYTTYTAQPLPAVEEIVVGSGETQRSMLTEFRVLFRRSIEVGEGAFQVEKLDPAGGIVDLSISEDNSTTKTIVLLSFSGEFTEPSGSLVDGNYMLTINGDNITAGGTAVDVDGDGSPGGLLVFGDKQSDALYRLFGDSDQNRTVNILDLLGFRQTYQLVTGDASFDETFDSNLDGRIDIFDLLRFRQNWLKEMPFVDASSRAVTGKGSITKSKGRIRGGAR